MPPKICKASGRSGFFSEDSQDFPCNEAWGGSLEKMPLMGSG